MSYQSYPKAMAHPQAQAAVISGYKRNNDGTVNNDSPGKPAKFPPVNVNNLDQEQQYASLGYLPVGVEDPVAYLRATIGASEPDGHVFNEFPKWLYKCDDDGVRSELVTTEARALKLGAGWCGTPDAATAVHEGESEPETTDAAPKSEPKAKAVLKKASEKRKYAARKPKVAPQEDQQPAA